MKNQRKRQKDLDVLKSGVPTMPVFILVRPQMAENIGMAARAMMNCGIYDLRIVAPRELPTCEVALSASSGADAILKSARVFDTVEQAVSDLNFVFATTARARYLAKDVVTTQNMPDVLKKMNIEPSKIGVLFGCERTGLENEELNVADALLTIPLNPEHTSLNLSQAVLLVGFVCFNVLFSGFEKKAEALENKVATKAELCSFLEKLDRILLQNGYYWLEDKRPKMQSNLNNIFFKAGLTSQEVRTLHGVLNFLSLDEEKIKKDLQLNKKSDINY